MRRLLLLAFATIFSIVLNAESLEGDISSSDTMSVAVQAPQEIEPTDAVVHFPVGSSTWLSGFRNNRHELARIRQIIDSNAAQGNGKIRQIVLRGYTSPEGDAIPITSVSHARASSASVQSLSASSCRATCRWWPTAARTGSR